MGDSPVLSAEFIHLYTVYRRVTGVLTILSATITVLVVIKASTRTISTYKWYLLADLICSGVFDCVVSGMGAVSLLPIPCYYSTSWLQYYEFNVQMTYAVILALSLLARVLSTVFLIAYRFLKSLPPDSWLQYINFTELSTSLHIFCIVSISITVTSVCSIPVLLHLPEQKEFHRYLGSIYPSLNILFMQYPHALCFSNSLNLQDILLLSVIMLLLCPLAAFVILGFVFYYTTKSRTRVRQSTYHVQMMLFKSLSAQTLCTIFFVVIPGVIVFALPTLGYQSSPARNVIAVMFYLSHSPFNCFMMIFFIRPFRIYFVKIMFRRDQERSPSVSFSRSVLFISRVKQ